MKPSSEFVACVLLAIGIKTFLREVQYLDVQTKEIIVTDQSPQFSCIHGY
jgi:hypothetical protein